MLEKERVCGLLLATDLPPIGEEAYAPLERALAALRREGVEQTVAVLAGEPRQLGAEFGPERRVRPVFDPDCEQGPFASIRAGLDAILELGDFEAFLLQPVCLPELPQGLVRRLRAAFEPGRADIVLPEQDGRRGLPALYSMTYAHWILFEDYPEGLHSLLEEERDRVCRVRAAAPGTLLPETLPQAYRRAVGGE